MEIHFDKHLHCLSTGTLSLSFTIYLFSYEYTVTHQNVQGYLFAFNSWTSPSKKKSRSHF